MKALSLEVKSQINELQLRYISALDKKNMKEWLHTFSADGSYFCRTMEAEDRGMDISFIHDDCHDRLEDRVTFVERVWAGTFQDYQTRHFTQRITCDEVSPGVYKLVTNVSVAFTRSDTGQTELMIAGQYVDVVEADEKTASFKSKKLIIDSPSLPHYIVYPL